MLSGKCVFHSFTFRLLVYVIAYLCVSELFKLARVCLYVYVCAHVCMRACYRA